MRGNRNRPAPTEQVVGLSEFVGKKDDLIVWRDLAGAVGSEGETCGSGAILDAEFREHPLEIFADRSRF